MPRDLFQHVVKEADARVDRDRRGIIEINTDADLRFICVANTLANTCRFYFGRFRAQRSKKRIILFRCANCDTKAIFDLCCNVPCPVVCSL